jgi:hypothetical protein
MQQPSSLEGWCGHTTCRLTESLTAANSELWQTRACMPAYACACQVVCTQHSRLWLCGTSNTYATHAAVSADPVSPAMWCVTKAQLAKEQGFPGCMNHTQHSVPLACFLVATVPCLRFSGFVLLHAVH